MERGRGERRGSWEAVEGEERLSRGRGVKRLIALVVGRGGSGNVTRKRRTERQEGRFGRGGGLGGGVLDHR